MKNREFHHWFHRYQQQALMQNERRLLVLVGDYSWSSSLLKSIDSDCCDGGKYSESTWLVYGESEQLKPNVAKQRFKDKLGSESNFVVFHGTEQSIDAFAALSGTLVAGGILFLLIKDISRVEESLFYQRFFKTLNTFTEHIVINENQTFFPDIISINPRPSSKKSSVLLKYNCVTQDQLAAVEAVLKVQQGKRNKPLVLTADRGRGKSSALAIACAEILKAASKECLLRLVITGPDITALSVFYHQLAISLPNGELHQNKFYVQYASVEFIAIDQLLNQPVEANLLLIDEAAAIPIYLLEQLLSHYSRLVFSSTVHGYEGAGRGFTLKFQQTLTKKHPSWVSLHLHEPIRWRVNDPLEKLVFESCLLNAELSKLSVSEQKIKLSQLLFKQFNADELIANEPLLKQIFAVLVTAHYQTKPSDVQILLDNDQVKLVCLLTKEESIQQVVAVALLINEGMIESNHIKAEDINAVNHSKRRLKNHFVPQSLLTQCGIEYAFDYHYLRVMRIAVHPQLQQQGIGRCFLNKITEFSRAKGAHFLASSFGATSELLSFWLTNDFRLARIGFNKDKASGEQSALVLKALSPKVAVTIRDINHEFYRSLEYLLVDEYKYLTPLLVAHILNHSPKAPSDLLSVRDKANVEAFAYGHRQYSSCVYSLHLWLKVALSGCLELKDKDLLVFISRIMQKHSIKDVCNTYGFTGKKELEQFLKSKVKAYLTS